MGNFVECGVTEKVLYPERYRHIPTWLTAGFWEQMQRPIDEQCLFTLATLEFLEERLLQAIQHSHYR